MYAVKVSSICTIYVKEENAMLFTEMKSLEIVDIDIYLWAYMHRLYRGTFLNRNH